MCAYMFPGYPNTSHLFKKIPMKIQIYQTKTTVDAVIRVKFIAIYGYVRKFETFQINNLMTHVKTYDKQKRIVNTPKK